MTHNTTAGLLQALSAELAGVVEKAEPSIVKVNDGSRLTASGVIWSADGVIVTTSHGVERDEDLTIVRSDGSTLPATLVGRDPDTDVAVLRVNATGLPAIQLAPSEEVRVGNLAIALARPGNIGLQATLGLVTGRIDSQTHGSLEYVIHTDAFLYPGFSGGALVDVQGRAIGLLNLIFGRGKGVALGSPVVANAVNALLAHGRVQRGYLGIRTQTVVLPANLRQSLALEHEHGLLVMQVEANSPAEKAAIMLGDTLLEIDGRPVEDAEALRQKLRTMRAGETVSLRLLRGGALTELSAVLGAEA